MILFAATFGPLLVHGIQEGLQGNRIIDEERLSYRSQIGQFQFEFQEMVNQTFTVGFSWNQFTEYQINKVLSDSQPGRRQEFLQYQTPLLSLEEAYLNTKVKYLTGIVHWTALEKIATCHLLTTVRDMTDIDSLLGLVNFSNFCNLFLNGVILQVGCLIALQYIDDP